MNKFFQHFCTLTITLLAVVATQAQQPANDNFVNAWTLTGGTVTTNGNSGQNGVIGNATRENGEPFITGNQFFGGRSVWFQWTAPSSASVRLDTIGSSFNTLLGVYLGTAVNALSLVASNDNFGGLDGGVSQLDFQAVQGTIYRIVVDGRGRNFGSASGPYVLNLRTLASVVITTPTNGSAFTTGSSIPIDVTASVPTPPVTRVDFYRAGSLIGSDTTSPFSLTTANSPPGNNNFFAVAVDSGGLSWTSAVVNVLFLSPGLTITSPADGTAFLNANPITVTAVGLLASGTMTNVEFQVDGATFAQDATAPFSAVWSGVTEGGHVFTAIGRDNSGNLYQSAPVGIAVARTLVASNSVWKYLDNGSDQGSAWIAPAFDDSAWASGPAPLGYGDSSGRPVLTTTSFGPDTQNKYPTTYFRQSFVANNIAGYSNLTMRLERDDGAIVYLNGVELSRFNMPGGAISFTNSASGNAADDGTTVFTFTAPATRLVEGNNVLAVEVHQDVVTSSDIWMVMDLLGVPVIPRNLPPAIIVTSPTNNAYFLAPASVTVTATASDNDGTVTNVAFRRQDIYGNDVLIGVSTNLPYEATWNSPTPGWYYIYAIATDDLGTSTTSAGSFVTIYDAIGTPRVQIFSPATGTTFQGPTNVALFAGTTSPSGITNVTFQTNGVALGQVAFPTSFGQVSANFTWTNAAYGTAILTAVSFDAAGLSSTSAPVTVIVDPPPPNLFAPTIAAVTPARGAAIGSLTSIQVTFSERVIGVSAGDLLVNGVAASSVSGSGSNYTFTVGQPAVGTVTITWASAHGIEDIGIPPLPFDQNGSGASWTYNLTDLTPPTIASRNPASGATVTNLTQLSVTFSESVSGVDAADLLVNGTPAIGLTGGGASYTFAFSQPPAGTVNISWAVGHGLADLATPPNAFNATGAGATWTYTLDSRTVLVQSNSTWLFIKGFAEASSPSDAWRALAFNDAIWSNAPAPFFYGDTTYTNATTPGTAITDMLGGSYSSIYLRKKFVLGNAAGVTNLFLNTLIDDGFIAWINGVEVARVNMAAGDIPYNGAASVSANEPGNAGVPYILYTLNNTGAYLVDGTNELAVHAFNNAPATSTDFGFNAQLYTFLADPSLVAPRLASVNPAAGDLFYLTNITVTFTEPVGNVDADDMLINGVAATSVTGGASNSVFTFSFTQPAYGNVAITWLGGHNIADFDAPPKAFDGAAVGSTFAYSLLNPSAPTVAAQTPLAGAAVASLAQIIVTFSEPVTGVNATDLLINGAPATGISGGPSAYTFTFAQPGYGNVSVGWAGSHGIADLEAPANAFDASRAGSSWTYTLVDQAPPTLASKNPPAGAQVTNLTSLSVSFSESVTGVNASDLLLNGVPATGLSGGPATYTFTFAQPNAVVINVTWAANHGIRDLAPAPNPFDANAPGATWSYLTPDNVAPSVAAIDPPPFVTVRSLTSIRVTFTEPVFGVDTNDLFINNRKPTQVSGSGAGPYTFNFLAPSNGPVDVRWVVGHGITDLASPPNPFAGGEWTYTLDPNAAFAGNVLISEIMFNPLGGRVVDEWIELHNITDGLINVAGWRFNKGVNFTFPNVAIPAQGRLVIAANLAAFQAKYPAVTNVIGGWAGSLANSDETIELSTPLGETVNTVHYATEGDWARRERGNGAQRITSLTRSGTTATVTIFGHGYTANDQVVISGADQPEYNGRFVVNSVSVSAFNITVAGTPATPATGNVLSRQILDDGFSGWSWFSAADGLGSSLELIHAAMPNDLGQNWNGSSALNGTPGAANSVAATNAAPFLLEVTHFPPVPKSADPVAITARVRDELSNGVASVTLFYRAHTGTSPGGFSSTNMLDDGMHSDGVSGDGLFGVDLPTAANGTVLEFYVQAADTGARTRTWPAPAWDTNNTTGQFANALYQVDNEGITNLMPVVRLVLSGTERAIFPPGSRSSDAAMNATMISMDGEGAKVRYTASVRVRGAGSRTRNPPNNRVNIPNDNRWNGLKAVNFNSQFVHAQLIGNQVAQKSGLPAADAHVVQYRINGVNPAPVGAPANGSGNGAGYGTFLMIEPVNGDLAADWFPEDGGGNVYRASTGNHNADLSYGADPNYYLTHGYYKTANQTENDWTDMQRLTFAFSQVAADSDFVQAIATNVNVVAWMRYFAIGSLMNFTETSLFNGRGDDYALYRGEVDQRFVLIGHDFDTVFGQGDTLTGYPAQTNSSIYIMINPPNGNANVPLLRRFMTNSAFAPAFFAELKRLSDTTFNPTNLNPLMDQLLTGWGVGPSAQTITDMKTHAANRRANVLAQIPLALTVGTTLATANGYLSTATPGVTLFGASHAIDTRKVLVNGVPSIWSAWEARWTNTVSLQPGINRVLVQSLNSNDVEFARATVEIWYDDGSTLNVSGAITSDTLWTAATGPYNVTASVTVNSGVTLTIQAGTTLYLGSGVNITVANGGRLLAEGTATAPIRFSRTPGTGTSWGGITVNGGAGSPETRIAHAHFEFNGSTAVHATDGTVFLDHLTFGSTGVQYVSLDRSSFVVQDCVFPAPTAGFEPVHGSGGIKAGGRGIVRRNFWGRVNGYNDAFDFSGGNRPGPILQVLNNVFAGSDDDLLDLDSTDAWIEGNIFLHCHRQGASPDSASAVSGGSDNASNSEITIIGNIFYDCDQAANAKQTNFYTLINNTIVRQTRTGSLDPVAGVVILADDTTSQGAGTYLEGNIIYDAENLTRNVTTAIVTFTNNIITQLQGAPWTGLGGGNVNADPLFVRVPTLAETTNFNSWAEAQVWWNWLSLRSGSPALGTGPNGRDKGAVIPLGATISGEPVGATPLNSAMLRVGVNRTGNGIPVGGFPNGSGFTHYRWRLDSGVWSAETPIATPIALNNLAAGPHYVEVSGKNDAGFYQDDAVFGVDAVVTLSRTWTVDPNASLLRLNEILASNAGALVHTNTTPDAIELYNAGATALDLSGVRLTREASDPDKFIFPPGASLAAGAYLTVFANNPDGTPGYHVGFNLSQGGDTVYLYDAAANGGALIDSITFGLQLSDLSIGRLADGAWALTQPTFGAVNQGAATGDPARLRINEWLAIAQSPFNSDFIELYNGDARPVSLGGLYLSDEIIGWPNRHQIAALSFMPGNGYLRFLADGNANAGAEHLNFNLSGDQGAIGLYRADLTPIDCVMYQPQLPNISQGRSPNGSLNIVFFDTPTPGAPNPILTITPSGGALVLNEVLANNAAFVEADGRTPDWIELYNGTTNLVSLADLSLTDDTLQPRRFVFAPGTELAPGGYVRVLCDPNATNVGPLLTTNFALKATGGAVYLFDSLANFGGLLNAISYGLQVSDLSIGRVPSGGATWVLTTPTPNAANVAVATLGDINNLKVNEWMADPGMGKDDWFEIYNPSTQPVALGGLYVTDDLNTRTKHLIPALSFMGAGTNAWQKFLADGNTGAGADHVNFSLRGAGEAVGLSTANGTLIDGYAFGVQLVGVSEGRFPDGGATVVAFPGTDSPAASNYRKLAEVVINEVLTHTDEPLEDAIELHNLTAHAIEVGGWWLSDDNGTLQKYQIPFGTTLPAHGFAVIYETHFTNRSEAAIAFALSSKGDEVVLSSATNGALTGYRASAKFGAANNGVSFGRYLTSDNRAEFVSLSARTFGQDDPGSVGQFRMGTGASNAYPRVGPVVVSEIMFHPPDLGTNDNVRDEFIELRNITTVTVPLFDSTNGWHLRDAVDFDFAPGTVLPAGETLLVVSFDPVNNPGALAAFRATYNLAVSVPIVGPYVGKLANGDDSIELRKPDAPNLDDVPYVLVERVHYYDTAPWPNAAGGADGTGLSLTRVSNTGFGNDATNWVADAPTPGPSATTSDSDGDGMTDAWETTYGFDPYNPADAALDSDGDGLKNGDEFLAGTNPRDPLSTLRLTIVLQPEGPHLSFMAISNHTYTVLLRESAVSGTWYPLGSYDAGALSGPVTIVDTNPVTAQRFYRVVCPEVPAGSEGPTVLENPPMQDASVGGEATFRVLAVGAGDLQYQWYAEDTLLAGASGTWMELTNLNPMAAGHYSVRIMDARGKARSETSLLVVRPMIVTQPEDQTVAPGAPAQFVVVAQSSEPLFYRWSRNNKSLAGQTNAVLMLPNVQLADEGAYRVVVSHRTPAGPSSVYSRSAVLRLSAGGSRE